MATTPPPDLNDLPRMVPDRDDIARRRRRAATPPPTPPSGGGPKEPGKSSGSPVWPLYMLCILLAGGIGYLYYTGQQASVQLAMTNAQLQSSNARIMELEGQLSATDESLSLNENAIQSKLNNILAEIRKLWDVADVRNRDNIRDNQAAITELQSLASRLRNDTTALQSEQQETITTLTQLLDNFTEEVALRADLQSVLTALEERQNATNTIVQRLNREDEALQARVDVIGLRAEGAVEQATELNQIVNRLRIDTDAVSNQLGREAQTRSALADSVVMLRSRIADLEAQSTVDLEDRLAIVETSRADITQRLANLQGQISQIRNELDEMNREVDDFSTEITP
ncbi:hypothetical protein ACFOSD_14685 [Salinispirillum marinum]|uniref:Uncharacterized protein n=2 Tax=Saccharospirillaceae TaxID=255527 RepID=A0ABV8BHP4_9GAMM